MATIEYERKDTHTTRCYLKENGRLVATIQNFGDFARIFPAVSMEEKLKVTDWRSVTHARAALEREATIWYTG